MEEIRKTLGEIGYEAYREQSGGKSLVTGQAIPEYYMLPPDIREAWEKAGRAVAASVGRADAS